MPFINDERTNLKEMLHKQENYKKSPWFLQTTTLGNAKNHLPH